MIEKNVVALPSVHATNKKKEKHGPVGVVKSFQILNFIHPFPCLQEEDRFTPVDTSLSISIMVTQRRFQGN